MTEEMARHIRKLYRLGMMQHDIAAHYRINQGRVSEVVNGKRFPE
jgi:predicted XRE-type DNA-binding protein